MDDHGELKLRFDLAVRNALLLGALDYILGGLGGWAISTTSRGVIPAVLGLVSSLFLAGVTLRIWWRTQGTL